MVCVGKVSGVHDEGVFVLSGVEVVNGGVVAHGERVGDGGAGPRLIFIGQTVRPKDAPARQPAEWHQHCHLKPRVKADWKRGGDSHVDDERDGVRGVVARGAGGLEAVDGRVGRVDLVVVLGARLEALELDARRPRARGLVRGPVRRLGRVAQLVRGEAVEDLGLGRFRVRCKERR